ncbi:hypothetical protein CTI12_AA396760 [Artemisia annua]|uniref:Uncharacterized protein n=1 Tax=Artemisia annua TaxID=35608 RepID=A0A2U1MA35_ARTAN|nr:hypothetical protein CTI12_AA396760 [Artemisia annua]
MSPDKVHLSKSNVPLPKMKEGKARRHRHGIRIKVSSPGSASVGAGSILRNHHLLKTTVKSRKRNESSPIDNKGAKRVIKSPNSDVEGSNMVSNLMAGSIDSNLSFEMGSTFDNKSASKLVDSSVKACGKNVIDPSNIVNGNDGSFINLPLDVSPIQCRQSSPVARNCGLETSFDTPSAGDVVSISSCGTGGRDGIVGAKTGLVCGEGIAGPNVRNEHTSMEGVVNAGGVSSNNMNGIACNKVGMDFEFGKSDSGKGILNKPSVPLLKVQFGSNVLGNPFIKNAATTSYKSNWSAGFGNAFGSTILSNQYSVVADRFAEKLKKGTEEMALKMEYTPGSVTVQENGNRRIKFSAEEVYKGGQTCSLQLYGYFVGTSMDYRVGMKSVLDSRPWMVQNVPIVLNLWEPGIWLDMSEPTTIPIWVCVYNIPMELCNGNGIGKIMSGVGRPMLMDKMTKERCLKKAGKLDFARVLVGVSAEEELPNVLEISYPPLGNRPARVGKLDVKYQWKPPLCTHCKTFGHSTISCKNRPRTQEELAAHVIKEAIRVQVPVGSKGKDVVVDEEGFSTVGKKNRSVVNNNTNGMSTKTLNVQNTHNTTRSGVVYGVQSTNAQGLGKKNAAPTKKNKGNTSNMQSGKGRSNGLQGNGYSKQGLYQVKGNKLSASKSSNGAQNGNSKMSGGVNPTKNLQQISKDPNFKPRVLIRGSGSTRNPNKVVEESIPLSNTFAVLIDDEMLESCNSGEKKTQEEYDKEWPKLRSEVDVFMQADDEDDVDSECEGIAKDMRPEYDVNAASNIENDATPSFIVSNGD